MRERELQRRAAARGRAEQMAAFDAEMRQHLIDERG